MKRKVLFVAVASLFADTALAQTPVSTGATTGSSVATGQHTVVTQGTQRAIFDWSSFNIGSGASVTFNQPNSTSLAVNRISGGRTTIDGALTATGHVMLLNANGVLFGQTAAVNVGSLTASTGRLASTDDAAFIHPSNEHLAVAIIGATSNGTSNGTANTYGIENQGTISATGMVAFVAPSVANFGTITALAGRITLAGAQAATVSLNGGLYELAVDMGIDGSSVTNRRLDASRPGVLSTGSGTGTIVLTALDAANVASGLINLEGVQRANRIEVHGGEIVLKSDLEASTVTGSSSLIKVHNGAQIGDAVSIAKSDGAVVEVHGGSYTEAVTLDKANMRVSGTDDATLTVAPGTTGFAITANDVTLEGMKIVGPHSTNYTLVDWNNVQSTMQNTTAVSVRSGVAGATIHDNDIRNVRTGITILGDSARTSITGNTIDNTKGSILLRSNDVVTISDNSAGPNGNEWDIVLMSNILDGKYFRSHSNLAQYSADMMAMSAANGGAVVDGVRTTEGGMHILDRRYSDNNRSHVNVEVDRTYNIVTDDFGLGNGLGNARQPLGTIAAGINAVVAGGYVDVAAGTYAESVSITKALTLKGAGAGSSIIDPVSGDAVSISGNMGANAKLVIDGFTFTGATYGVQVAGTTVLGNLTVQNSDFLGNLKNGFFVNGDKFLGAPGLTNVSLLNDTFEHNGAVNPTSLGWGDILFNFYNGNATLSGLRIHGGGEYNGIQMRGASPTANTPQNAGTVVFNDVIIDGPFLRPAGSIGTFNPSGPGAAIHLLEYASVANVSFTDVDLAPSIGHGLFIEGIGTTLNLGNTNFGTPDPTPRGTSVDDTHPQQVSRNILAGTNNNNLLTYADARATKFNDVAVSGMTTAQLFGIEDRITHALDRSGLGLVRLKTDNIYVTEASGSIQRGVDAASSGDTLNVQAGTYTVSSTISVNKELSILGPNAGTHGNSDSRVAEAIITSTNPSGPAIRVATTAPVTIDGLKFEGGAAHPIDSADPASNITLRNNVFSNHTRLLYFNAPAQLTLERNRFTNVADVSADDSMLVAGNWNGSIGTVVTIRDNLFENPGTQGGGVNLSNVSGLVTGNTFKDLKYYGILLANNSSSISITNNLFDHITNPDPVGSTSWGAGIRFYTPSFTGPVVISGNEFTNSAIGVSVRTGSDITGMNVQVVDNSFHSNAQAIRNEGTGTLNASRNWWGSTDATAVAAQMTGAVDFSPMLGSGTDANSSLAGFQGSRDALYVTALGAQSGSIARIKEGVDLANAGGTVNVGSGTYAESVVLNGLRNLMFDGTTIEGLTINAGAAGSGIGGSVTASTATGFDFTVPVVLVRDTVLDTSVAGGAVSAVAIDGTTPGGQTLRIRSGAGTVSLGNLGSATRLGATDVAGAAIRFTGSDYFANSLSFAGPMSLGSQTTTLRTNGGSIVLNGDIQNADGSPHALSLLAGGGDVSMVSGGTLSNPLGHFNVLADDFSLASTLWVSGYDINATGNVALSDHTLNSLGALLSLISAGGNVTGSTTSQGSVQIAGGGDVITNIVSLGNVAVVATNVGGSITGGFIVIGAQNEVNANVNALQVVEIQAGGGVTVSGTAQSLVIDAPSGNASGDFGEVVNTGGTVNVNGRPRPNVRVTEMSTQMLVPTTVVTAADSEAGPATPAGGMKPALKLLTAEAKEAQPRSGLSDAAELLRQGQSVEIDLTPGNS